jgi:RimJ/RimL family protein N-acetyltransferase
LIDGEVVGCVVKFIMEGNAEITYAIDKKFWGQGITTIAVKQFLEEETTRPI